MTVQEAAAALGVDERAVRFMVASGELDAVKRGRAWWIDRRGVERRARHRPGRGRPLSPRMAWAVLLLASGDDDRVPPLAGGRRQARRACKWLGSHELAQDAARLRARARRESFEVHPSELSRVRDRDGVMPTGIAVAREVGIHGGGREVELYVAEGRRGRLVEEHALEPGHGPLVMRWVPDDVWPLVAAPVAPRAAMLVDLLEHDDPRARREAAHALTAA